MRSIRRAQTIRGNTVIHLPLPYYLPHPGGEGGSRVGRDGEGGSRVGGGGEGGREGVDQRISCIESA